MIESGIVGRVTSGIVGRLGGGLPLRPKFALDPLDLTDQFGNTPEAAIRASAGTVFDYAGVLQTIPTDMHRLSGGRYSGGAWYRDDGAGNSLHPHRNIDGVLVPWTYPDWTIGAWSAGSYCNDGTYYYYTLAGGIDSAAFGDGITWVNMGLYDRTYGLLCSKGSTNINTNSNKAPAVNASMSPAAVDNNATGLDGSASATTYVGCTGFNQKNITTPADTLTYCLSCFAWAIGAGAVLDLQFTGFNGGDNNSANGGYYDFDTDTFNAFSLSLGYKRQIMPDGRVRIWRAFTNTSLTLFILRHTAAGTMDNLVTEGWQLEVGDSPSAYIPTGAAAASSDPDTIKWADAFINQAKGHFEFVFYAGSIVAGEQYLSINGAANSLLYASAADTLAMADGTNVATVAATPNKWNQVIGTWDAVGNMQLSCRNASDGGAWVDGTAVAYDGGFADGGFITPCAGLDSSVIVRELNVYDV